MAEAQLPAPGGADNARIVDLVLGAWRPREAAVQLAASTGVTLAPGFAEDAALSPMTTDLRGVDVAAAGDPVAALAHDDATRLAGALTNGIVVLLAPRDGRGIGTLNDWLFFYLRRSGLSLAVIGDEPATTVARSVFERRRGLEAAALGKPIAELALEQQRLLRFFPGLLPRPIAERHGLDPVATALVPIGPGHFLIPPGYRDTDPATAPATLDAMEAMEGLDDGFRAIAQTFCTSHFADSEALAALAGRAFCAGEIDLGRDLAGRARAVARTPEAAAAADLVRNDIRVHQRRFAEVIATPEPSRQAPQELRARLAGLRLRAAIEQNPRGGTPAGLDRLIGRFDAGTADAGDLHLLSLQVAARIAAGEGEAVRPLALKVDAALGEAADSRLVQASAMNLAELARIGGDFAGRRAQLDRAFAASAGARSLGEVVTMNALIAGAGADPASPAAGQAWLRAALAWLAFEPVEALPAAAVEAVLATPSVARGQLDQLVSEALSAALATSWQGLAVKADKDSAAFAVRDATRNGGAPERLIGGPGASVLWSPARPKGQGLAPPRSRLLGLVVAALRELCPAAEPLGYGTILVDDNVGLDLPKTRDEALSVAFRAGVREALFGRDRIALDAAARPRIATDLRVGLSPVVAGIGGPDDRMIVRFRRHLAEAELTGLEADILVAVRGRGRLPLGSLAVLLGKPLAEMERHLRNLEGRRIVRVDLESR